MPSKNETRQSSDRHTLHGARAWLITDGKPGHEGQAIGVAEALGLDFELKRVAPSGLFKLLAPWGPVDPQERFGQPGSAFAPPWPQIAIGVGRLSMPYMRVLRRAAGPATFTLVLQDPRTGSEIADLIWVPTHDRRRGDNVITTMTAPHRFSPQRIEQLRACCPAEIDALPQPRVLVLLGGTSRAFRFARDDWGRLGRALDAIGRLGAGFMITPSRRTPRDLLEAVDRATAPFPRALWRGEGDNPYPAFLAHADVHIVTADSVSMTGEVCATGRPVYVFEPSGGSAKFVRFHQALQSAGATRRLPGRIKSLDQWSYEPLHAAQIIAAETERRWREAL